MMNEYLYAICKQKGSNGGFLDLWGTSRVINKSHCVLKNYCSFSGWREKIPFVKPAPIDEEEKKKSKKQKAGQQKKEAQKGGADAAAQGVSNIKLK